jgi:hypothetical protein
MSQINGVAALMQASINLQIQSIATQSTISGLNNLLSDANEKLTAAWTSDSDADPKSPAYPAFYYLQCIIQNTSSPMNTSVNPPQQYTAPAADQQPATIPTTMDAWIDTFLGKQNGSETNVLDFSQAFMLTVYNAYMNSSPSSKDPRLAIINSETSLLSSAGSADEKTTENGINLTNNLGQHSQSASPLNNISSSLTDLLNSGSSAISQITA